MLFIQLLPVLTTLFSAVFAFPLLPSMTLIAGADQSLLLAKGGARAAVRRGALAPVAVAKPNQIRVAAIERNIESGTMNALPPSNLQGQFSLRAKAISKPGSGAEKYLEKSVSLLESAKDKYNVLSTAILKKSVEIAVLKDKLANLPKPSSADDLLAMINLQTLVEIAEKERVAMIRDLRDPKRAIKDAESNIQSIAFHAIEQADDTPLTKLEARKMVPSLEASLAKPDGMTEEAAAKLKKKRERAAILDTVLTDEDWFIASK